MSSSPDVDVSMRVAQQPPNVSVSIPDERPLVSQEYDSSDDLRSTRSARIPWAAMYRPPEDVAYGFNQLATRYDITWFNLALTRMIVDIIPRSMGGRRSKILPPFTTHRGDVLENLNRFYQTMEQQPYSKAMDYILNINFIADNKTEYVNSILYINVLKAGSRQARFEYFCPRHTLYSEYKDMRKLVCAIIDYLAQEWAGDLAQNACDRLCQVYTFGQFFPPSNLYIAHFLQLRQSQTYDELQQVYRNVRTEDQGTRIAVAAVRVIQKIGQLVTKCIQNSQIPREIDESKPYMQSKQQLLKVFGPDAQGDGVTETMFRSIEPILRDCRIQPEDYKIVDELITNDRWKDLSNEDLKRWERFIELPNAVAPTFKGRLQDIQDDDDLVERSENIFE